MVAPTKPSVEHARFLRTESLAGLEALHATFVTHRYVPHVHDSWTIAQVASGAARFQLEGRWHTADSGTSFLIPPGAVHTGESASPGGYTYRVLYIEPQALSERSGHELRGGWRQPPVVVSLRSLAQALERLHTTLRLAGVALERGEALSSVCRELVTLIDAIEGPDRVAAGRHPAIEAVREYIHEHWREDFTIDELARVAGLSAFHLVRRFHDQVGMPPSAYRRALRVQAAQRLLRAGVLPALVAAESGFYDQSHLNRHFKRATGVTPLRYMRANV